MKIVFAGMPGVGKGTVAEQLEKEFGLKHISTGELLRSEVKRDSKLGRKVKSILEAGNLVSDDLMVALVENNIKHLKAGFILDGFPRTLYQVKCLERITNIDRVVYLDASDSILLDRLLSRAEEEGDIRKDDNEKVILDRFRIFRFNTSPILDYYKQLGILIKIDAMGARGEVYALVKRGLQLGT